MLAIVVAARAPGADKPCGDQAHRGRAGRRSACPGGRAARDQQLGLARQLPTSDDTRRLGRELGALLRAGDLVVLTGPLGAGKTVFVQGVGAGLGVRGPVVSPTFVIARVHRDGRVPLVHVDAYRLGSLAEVDDLDLDVDLADSVLAVEWGAGLVEQLTDSRVEVQLTMADRRRAALGCARPARCRLGRSTDGN